jgi:chromosomal replication initiator protein
MNDIEILKKIVCDEMDITIEDFENNLSRQFRKYVIPRQIIFYILKNYENMTITAIGKLLNKDHATVVYSCKVIQNLIDTDKFLREKILNCEKKYKIIYAIMNVLNLKI